MTALDRAHSMRPNRLAFSAATAVLVGCLLTGCAATGDSDSAPATETRQVMSLLGEPLAPLTFDEAQRAALEENLSQARRDFESDPDDEMNIIWLGRRLAYLGRYQEAIDVYTEGIAKHPHSYRLLRHRGHRYITTRQLDNAVADFARAAELAADHDDQVEPDGAPNKHNIPTSTTHSNIYYHLGLAHYLQGDFDAALNAYANCLPYSRNNDMAIATTYWLYLTAKQLGHENIAAGALKRISPDMQLLENHDYHRLLLMFKGELSQGELLGKVESGALSGSTITYGVAMHRIFTGEQERGMTMLRNTIKNGFWPAFGSIAAEAELARMK